MRPLIPDLDPKLVEVRVSVSDNVIGPAGLTHNARFVASRDEFMLMRTELLAKLYFAPAVNDLRLSMNDAARKGRG